MLIYFGIQIVQGKAPDEYPDDIKALIGKEVLFKVEKLSDHGTKYDDSYKVKKTCDDKFIIDLFNDKTKIETPTKVCYTFSLMKLFNTYVKLSIVVSI